LERNKKIGFGQWYVSCGLDTIGIDNNSSVAKPFGKVQKRVIDLLNGRILVGHAVHNDLEVLVMFMFMRLKF
jgi:hypothetical protein